MILVKGEEVSVYATEEELQLELSTMINSLLKKKAIQDYKIISAVACAFAVEHKEGEFLKIATCLHGFDFSKVHQEFDRKEGDSNESFKDNK